MNLTRKDIVRLEFDPTLDNLDKDKKIRDGLSVVTQIGNTLWVANDEAISLERLSNAQDDSNGNYHHYSQHKQFRLDTYINLPVPPATNSMNFEEADIEGLDYENGYLWLVGSHSLKRKQPKKSKDGLDKIGKQLEKVTSDGNRYLLARIPIVEREGIYTLEKEYTRNGKTRIAAQLRGNAKGSELTEALKDDEHLKAFLGIPGKDNGFDIEGRIQVTSAPRRASAKTS